MIVGRSAYHNSALVTLLKLKCFRMASVSKISYLRGIPFLSIRGANSWSSCPRPSACLRLRGSTLKLPGKVAEPSDHVVLLVPEIFSRRNNHDFSTADRRYKNLVRQLASGSKENHCCDGSLVHMAHGRNKLSVISNRSLPITKSKRNAQPCSCANQNRATIRPTANFKTVGY